MFTLTHILFPPFKLCAHLLIARGAFTSTALCSNATDYDYYVLHIASANAQPQYLDVVGVYPDVYLRLFLFSLQPSLDSEYVGRNYGLPNVRFSLSAHFWKR